MILKRRSAFFTIVRETLTYHIDGEIHAEDEIQDPEHGHHQVEPPVGYSQS